MRTWADENPYFLLIVRDASNPQTGMREHAEIDLGQSGWSETYADWMRGDSLWYLCHKEGQVKLAMIVADGEQPYYTKRHIGQIAMSGAGREIACYGIGKKRLDGHIDRMWVLPDGYAVCAGNDVEPLAMEVVRTMAWQQHPAE